MRAPKAISYQLKWAAVLAMSGVVLFCSEGEDAKEKSVASRIADRTFPSVFQAWNPADNLREDPVVTQARHDLILHGEAFFGLTWDHTYPGLATAFTPDSLQQGLERRRDLMRRNPNLILLMEIKYRDAPRSFLPEGHKWWLRDGEGNIVSGWEEGKYLQLDFSNPEYREQVAVQADAAMKSGVFDGIMLDYWWEWENEEGRLALVKAIRDRIGDEALILTNPGDRTTPKTAPFINGYYMECVYSTTAEDWKRIADTLMWAENNLRPPRINCLETWFHKSRADESLMRATTTLSLTLSDGYCLFSDPNPLPVPDHLHNWYPFWERRLGKARASGVLRPDGAWMREYANGTVVYNPMGNPAVTITLDEPRTSAATGKRAETHTVQPCDGDLLLRED